MKEKARFKQRRVACSACGRVIAARKDGRPKNHAPKNRINGGEQNQRNRNLGWCDGVNWRGYAP